MNLLRKVKGTGSQGTLRTTQRIRGPHSRSTRMLRGCKQRSSCWNPERGRVGTGDGLRAACARLRAL